MAPEVTLVSPGDFPFGSSQGLKAACRFVLNCRQQKVSETQLTATSPNPGHEIWLNSTPVGLPCNIPEKNRS